VGTVWFNEDDNGYGRHSVSIKLLYNPSDEDGRQQATTLGRDDITADDVMGAMHYRRLNRRL